MKHVWHAVYTKEKFLTVIDVLADNETAHKRNLKDMRDQFDAALEKTLRARTYTASYMQDALNLVDRHTRYRALFGEKLDSILRLETKWKEKAKARIECQKEESKRIEAKHKAQREAQRVERAKAYEAWKQGQIVLTSFYDFPVALRVSADGANVETSKGADVPVNHARRLWAVIQRIKASGVPYEHNGHTEHVGAFRVDSINAEGTLHAGCHTIEFAAMKELADKLGWV
jgi:dsDNA-specific endonuclease/ATPase MutS2